MSVDEHTKALGLCYLDLQFKTYLTIYYSFYNPI
jgi:hypothetical protein